MDYTLYLRAIVTLILLLAVMAALLWTLKRFNLVTGTTLTKSRDRRLGVVETLMLDGKRRLILIRRDGVEHLIVAGADGDTVIETGIVAPSSASFETPLRITPVLE